MKAEYLKEKVSIMSNFKIREANPNLLMVALAADMKKNISII